jgi:ribosome biogenesis ATPase
MIDPAMVRPGCFDKLRYLDLPKPSEISEILRTFLCKVPLGTSDERNPDSSADQIREEIEPMIAERGEGYNRADLAALVRKTGVITLKRTVSALDKMGNVASECTSRETLKVTVGLLDFFKPLDKVTPSVSLVQRRKYDPSSPGYLSMSG